MKKLIKVKSFPPQFRGGNLIILAVLIALTVWAFVKAVL
jgi:hypothetical protein